MAKDDPGAADAQSGELAQFVTETISQIALGLHAAQPTLAAVGGQLNPIGQSVYSKNGVMIDLPEERRALLQYIDFDVAVTRASSEAGRGGGSIRVMGLSIGGDVQSNADEMNVSRIHFSVPIVFPGQPNEETDRELKDRRERERTALQAAMDQWTPT